MRSTACALSLLIGALALPAPSPSSAPRHVAVGRKHVLTRNDGMANVPGIVASLNYTLSNDNASPLPCYAPLAEGQALQSADAIHKRQTANVPLTSKNQTFVSVATAAGFRQLDVDGICGMGFTAIAQDNGTTFFESLMEQDSVDADEFAFCLGRVASGTEMDSVMTLGGRDSTKYTGDFVTVPVTSQKYWQVALDGVVVDGDVVAGTESQAAIDTGTTAIVAPTHTQADIMYQIPGTFSLPVSGQNITIFPCDTAASYIPCFTFAGTRLAMNPLDFSFGLLAVEEVDLLTMGDEHLAADVTAKLGLADYCISSAIGADLFEDEAFYVIGDTFIKNWYSVFSYTANSGSQAVLFAPSIGQ